jgi:polyhydroxybutyrate depolymerase
VSIVAHPFVTALGWAMAAVLPALVVPAVDAQHPALRRRDRGAADGREILRHGGRARTYIVRAPTVRPGTRAPLVVVLHGGGGDATTAERMTGFTAKARAERFVVVYPDGTGPRRTALLTWNAGHCCGSAMAERVDDVGFVRALVDHLAARYPIDPRRVYVTGMSNGAMMTHRIGIELADRVAAIAPVVGAVFGDEARPRAPVSAIVFNGMRDTSVPYAGGPPGGRGSETWDGTPTRPAPEQARFWAAANGCAAPPRRVDHGAYVTLEHDCPAARDVVLHALKQGGHAWPGGERGSRVGDAPGGALDATDLIWRFFAAHPKR